MFHRIKIIGFLNLLITLGAAKAQDVQTNELWSPVPPVVTALGIMASPPADAIILFDGKNLNEWVSSKDSISPVQWPVSGKTFTVNKKSGDIQTKRSFSDYQLHVEWMIPKAITGTDQSRGNSGIFLASFNTNGMGKRGYELQILDSYYNKTYVNGQAGSIYRLYAPLANPASAPGSWNSFDVIWTAPRFNDNGTLQTPGYATVLFNGVLVQNHVEVKGSTGATSTLKKHGASPIRIQAHKDPSLPVSFRNIWIRNL